MMVSSSAHGNGIGSQQREAAGREKGIPTVKEMIKRIREEKGGFTLAELLIVVAIILVLVAIAVPVFTGAMDDANKAKNQGNESNVKSVASMRYLNAESASAGSGAAAASGEYYVDKNKDVVKTSEDPASPGTAPTDYLDGPIYVKATGPNNGAAGEASFEVSRSPIN